MDFELREQDRWLPIANVARLMKGTLPTTAKVSKDAKECMQECVSEFISFVTSEASDRCILDKRKTINGEDILYSLNTLGFENYSEILKIYLAKYREQQALRQERGEYKKKSSKKQPVTDKDSNEGNDNENDDSNDLVSKENELDLDKGDQLSNEQLNENNIKKIPIEEQQFFNYPADEDEEERAVGMVSNDGVNVNDDASSNGLQNHTQDGTSEEYVQQLYEQDYGDQSKIYTHHSQYHNTPANPHFVKNELDEDLNLLEKEVEIDTTKPPGTDDALSMASPHGNSRNNSSLLSNGISADALSIQQDVSQQGSQQQLVAASMLPNKSVSVADEATLSLNLNDNVNGVVVSETEELVSLTNGHHGENVLYRYQNDF